jgi:pilus assembly protein CpaC
MRSISQVLFDRRATHSLGVALLLAVLLPYSARAQETATPVVNIDLIAGRSLPITGGAAISKVTVANPDVADVVVISETEVVINAIATGETDVILWGTGTPRRHYRVAVRSSPERRQILLGVKFAEVRKDALRNISTSLRYREANGNSRAGAGEFRTDNSFDADGNLLLNAARYLTVLSTFNTNELLGLLDAEEQRGNARFLAEPNLMAANLEEASFLAGGEFPIPIVQGGVAGQAAPVVVQFREFGIRLTFKGEVLTDSLLKLTVKPEVSSLDYGNAITISGFQIPALRTRRVESTVDVLSNRSLIISGLFNEERERVKTGIPFLVNIPIIGDLLSSQRWVNNESELIVVVTPILMDPNNPRATDLIRFVPDTTLPARPALEKRLPVPPGTP